MNDPTTGSVRPRERSDLVACVQALWPVHLVDGYPIHWPDNPVAWLDPPGLTRAWVAERADQVVGHVGVIHAEGPGLLRLDQSDPTRLGIEGLRGSAIVTRLFVSPNARGSGLAATLLRAVQADARAADRRLMLEVIAESNAVRWYERGGWQLVDERWSHWRARDGHRRTVRVYLEPHIS